MVRPSSSRGSRPARSSSGGETAAGSRAGRNETVSREVIMRECARLFRERGFHATTMQDIGDQVGILKGSLYYHVESKDKILVDLLVGSVSDVHRATKAAVDETDGVRVKLRRLIGAELLSMSRHQDEIVIWLSERQREYAALKRVEELAREVDNMLRDILSEGAECGEWPEDHLRIAYQAIRGMIAWFPMWYRFDGPETVTSIATRFAGYAEAILDSATPLGGNA